MLNDIVLLLPPFPTKISLTRIESKLKELSDVYSNIGTHDKLLIQSKLPYLTNALDFINGLIRALHLYITNPLRLLVLIPDVVDKLSIHIPLK